MFQFNNWKRNWPKKNFKMERCIIHTRHIKIINKKHPVEKRWYIIFMSNFLFITNNKLYFWRSFPVIFVVITHTNAKLSLSPANTRTFKYMYIYTKESYFCLNLSWILFTLIKWIDFSGVVLGVGCGLVREAAGLVLGTYFRRRRQFVELVAHAGGGVGIALFSVAYKEAVG